MNQRLLGHPSPLSVRFPLFPKGSRWGKGTFIFSDPGGRGIKPLKINSL